MGTGSNGCSLLLISLGFIASLHNFKKTKKSNPALYTFSDVILTMTLAGITLYKEMRKL